MDTSNRAENYLHDLGQEIIVMARKASLEASQGNDPFKKGRQFALYEVLSLMREQAVAFGLGEEAIGLKEVNIEDFLK